MPAEMFRVGPTLLLPALPGFQFIVFRIAYKFPKRLLSSHFWSLQEKSQFAIEDQKKRLFNQRPVLRQLQSTIESIRNPQHQDICKEVVFKLGSGSHPSVHEIMRIKPLFENDPFSVKAMHEHGPRHIKSLCRLNGLHTWYLIRRRLYDRAELLLLSIMDKALMGEGTYNLNSGVGEGTPSHTQPPPPPPPTNTATNSDTVRTPSPSQPPTPPKKGAHKKVSNFMFAKFLSFIQGYQKIMEKRFPQAMHVYRVFVVGFKDFSRELAEYVKIKAKVLFKGVIGLTLHELDVYYRMPAEMFRVGPTLLLSALPGFQYIVFPIAYKFPKRLLSSHFWSLQEKSQFAIEDQKKRLFNQRPVLRQLQSTIESIRNPQHQDICKEVVFKLGSGSHPSVHEIMRIKPLFENDPFSIKAMHGPHIKSLCRLHGLHTWYLNRRRLYDRAEMLSVMDKALMTEGIFNLKTEELKSACFTRGLNAANTSHEDMVEFLQQWISVSSATQSYSYSLLLHLPVLLAYNNPNNWALLA